jgi:hypothetical protein
MDLNDAIHRTVDIHRQITIDNLNLSHTLHLHDLPATQSKNRNGFSIKLFSLNYFEFRILKCLRITH